LAIDQPFMYFQPGGTVGDPIKNLNAMGQATQTNMSSNVVPLGNTGLFANASTDPRLAQQGVAAPYTQVNNPFPGMFDPQPQPPTEFPMNAPGVPQMMVTPPNPYLNAPQIMEPGIVEDMNFNMNISHTDIQKLAEIQGNAMPQDRFRTNQVQPLGRAPSGDERAKNLYYQNMAGRGVGYAPEPEAGMPTDNIRTGQLPPVTGQYQGPQTGPMAPTDMTNEFGIEMNISDYDKQELARLQQGMPEQTIDGTVVTAEGQQGMTVLPKINPGQLSTGDKGIQGPSVDTTIQAPTTMATEDPQKMVEDTIAEEVTKTAEGQGFDPNAYYLFKGMLDTGALMRNMMQEPPPGQYLKQPHLERIRMDRTPYVDARQQVKEMGRASYRGARENISQMSDFLKMSQAVTTGTQEQMANITTAEAQQELAVDQQNQQIANQENMMQTDTMNREMAMNYQIQAEAQRYKDSMISHQLARIGDTAGAYAMYQNQKEQAMKQEEIQKKQANLANQMQVNWMKYEATKSELGSEAYAEAERSAINKYIKDQQQALLAEDDFKVLAEEFPDGYDPVNADMNALRYKNIAANVDYRKAQLQEPVKGENENVEDYNNRLATYEQKMADIEKAEKEAERLKTIVDAERKFMDRIKSDFDISGQRREFQSSYLEKAGLPTSAEFIQSVESAVDAYRQL
jgi:hypothetical protein